MHVVRHAGHDLDGGLVRPDPDPDRLVEVVQHEVAVVVDGGLTLVLLAEQALHDVEQVVPVVRLQSQAVQHRFTPRIAAAVAGAVGSSIGTSAVAHNPRTPAPSAAGPHAW